VRATRGPRDCARVCCSPSPPEGELDREGREGGVCRDGPSRTEDGCRAKRLRRRQDRLKAGRSSEGETRLRRQDGRWRRPAGPGPGELAISCTAVPGLPAFLPAAPCPLAPPRPPHATPEPGCGGAHRRAGLAQPNVSLGRMDSHASNRVPPERCCAAAVLFRQLPS
jgi:hypothetical protein